MRLEFSFAREVLAPCVHVVGTWAPSFPLPSLSGEHMSLPASGGLQRISLLATDT